MASYGNCGHFILLERLSDGGVASVFLAHPRGVRDLGHLYAVKWAHPHVARDQNLALSLVDETRIVRSLEHEHICRIHGYGMEKGRHYIVMEYIHGKDLRAVQLRAHELGEILPYSLAAWIVAKVADEAACGAADGWFYDDPSAPSSVVACPATCERIEAASDIRVNLLFGCATTLR